MIRKCDTDSCLKRWYIDEQTFRFPLLTNLFPFTPSTRSRRAHDALSEYFTSRLDHAGYTTHLSRTRIRMLHSTRQIVIVAASPRPSTTAFIYYLRVAHDWRFLNAHPTLVSSSPAHPHGTVRRVVILSRTSHYLQVMA